MSRADHAAIAVNENDDHRRREERAELQHDEHRIVAMQRDRADEQAAGQPHRPCTSAHPGRAVLSREVHDLREVRQHRDGDSDDTEDVEHDDRAPHSVTSPRRGRRE